MIEKVMDVVVVSSENVGSSVAGSVTESIMHPRETRSFVAHLTKALFAMLTCVSTVMEFLSFIYT